MVTFDVKRFLLYQSLLIIKATADYNIFNLIIISAAIFGFIFSIVVIGSKKFRDKTNKYLALVVLVLSLNNTYNWFVDTQLFYALEWQYYWMFFFNWDLILVTLFVYFLASYLQQENEIKKWYLYPFYFSVAVTVFLILYEIIIPGSYQENRALIRSYDRIFNYVIVFFTFFFIIKAFLIIRFYEKKGVLNKNLVPVQTLWLKQVLGVGLLLCLISLTVLLLDQFVFDFKLSIRQMYYFIWICLSLLIYCLGFLGVYHVGVFNQRKEIRSIEIDKHKGVQTPNLKPHLFEEIDKSIREEKLYLNPLLNLTFLADKFNLSEGYISQHINTYTEGNFSSYINSLRIEQAKGLLKGTEYAHFTVLAIGLESGFNSKTSFYNAFKKHTGMSPIQYRNG